LGRVSCRDLLDQRGRDKEADCGQSQFSKIIQFTRAGMSAFPSRPTQSSETCLVGADLQEPANVRFRETINLGWATDMGAKQP